MRYSLGVKQIAKLSGKYQTTIPAAMRRALGLHPGDQLVFELEDGDPARGSVVRVRRYPTLDELAGTMPVPDEVRGLSWSEIRERAWLPGDDHPSARR
jgi:AbrB family looped-hinge helix DNA binding protein